jgi:hypothetical protein
MRMAVLKIAALFSYCGGPLFINELLKPHLGVNPTFLVTFLPVGLMVLGALCLDETRNRWSNAAVWAGRQGLYIVLGMHLYALWCFVNGTRVPEQSLYYLGIIVGVVWSIAYLRAARHWTSLPDGSSRERDRDSTEPFEPS